MLYLHDHSIMEPVMRKHTVNTYFNLINDYFYIDPNGLLRYKLDGYLGRYKKDDLVKSHNNSNNYLVITVPKVRNSNKGTVSVRLAHVIWRLSGNQFPDNLELDHIDGNKHNNLLSNLRLVNRTINSKNRKKRSDNTSGITGVCWNKSHNAWCVRKTVNGIRLTTYCKTLDAAKAKIEEFQKMDSQYTARHGK